MFASDLLAAARISLLRYKVASLEITLHHSEYLYHDSLDPFYSYALYSVSPQAIPQ
jgi:hypothetical protein